MEVSRPLGDFAMRDTPFLDDIIECFGNIHLPYPPSNLVKLLSNIVMYSFRVATWLASAKVSLRAI